MRKLVVVAPHPDDESLGAGGLMYEAVRLGYEVYVVLLTAGDGFVQDAERYYFTLQVESEEFVHLGYERRIEVVEALRRLGVSSERVHILGFPDGGIDAMLLNHWSDTPFRSQTTGYNHVPYIDLPTHGIPYLGRELVRVLQEIFEGIQPDRVVSPSRFDEHPDHWACGAFTSLALMRALRTMKKAPKQVERWMYLVHWKAWPLPLGYHPDQRLQPPRALSETTIPINKRDWLDIRLGDLAMERKREAVMAHQSQVELIKPYMLAFVRYNEIFQKDRWLQLQTTTNLVLPKISALSRWFGNRTMIATATWHKTETVVTLEVRLLRALQPGTTFTLYWIGESPEERHQWRVTWSDNMASAIVTHADTAVDVESDQELVQWSWRRGAWDLSRECGLVGGTIEDDERKPLGRLPFMIICGEGMGVGHESMDFD